MPVDWLAVACLLWQSPVQVSRSHRGFKTKTTGNQDQLPSPWRCLLGGVAAPRITSRGGSLQSLTKSMPWMYHRCWRVRSISQRSGLICPEARATRWPPGALPRVVDGVVNAPVVLPCISCFLTLACHRGQLGGQKTAESASISVATLRIFFLKHPTC